MSRFLTAEHPEHGLLWAAVDPDAPHPNGRVAERRFVAFMAPFASDEDAAEALVAAGAVLRPGAKAPAK